MIICIPASEIKGLDSKFEPDFNRATNMVLYDSNTDVVRDSPVDPGGDMANIDALIDIVLCCYVESGVWQQYINRRVVFLGIDAETVREALEKYRKGDLKLVNVSGQETQESRQVSEGPGHVMQPIHEHCGCQTGTSQVNRNGNRQGQGGGCCCG